MAAAPFFVNSGCRCLGFDWRLISGAVYPQPSRDAQRASEEPGEAFRGGGEKGRWWGREGACERSMGEYRRSVHFAEIYRNILSEIVRTLVDNSRSSCYTKQAVYERSCFWETALRNFEKSEKSA